MTVRTFVFGGLLTVIIGFHGQKAVAQGIPSPYPPGYSPYLNLINPRYPFTSNYFSLFYPDKQIANNFQQLQKQNVDTRKTIETLNTRVGGTSHKVGFMTQSKYYATGSKNFGITNTTNTTKQPNLSESNLLKPYQK